MPKQTTGPRVIARPSVGNGLQFVLRPVAYLRELRHLHAGGPCLVLSDLCQQKQAPWRRIAILLAQSQDVAEQAFCSKRSGWRTNSGVVIVPPATQPPTRLQAFGGRISRASPEECRTRPQVRGRFQ